MHLYVLPALQPKDLIHRLYLASAILLMKFLKKEDPTHIAVVFDPSGPTFRHEAYTEYKANRDKQPEDITLSIPYIKEILKARGIPVIEVAGYEADDVIGTMSRMTELEGYKTYMMTPDRIMVSLSQKMF